MRHVFIVGFGSELRQHKGLLKYLILIVGMLAFRFM